MSYGGDTVAKVLMESLLEGVDFEIPDIDLDGDEFKFPYDENSELYKPVHRLTNEDLTTRKIGGDGAFDALMAGFTTHLKNEYEKSRISGGEYTKAYVALTTGAMANAVQFLLGRDTAFWQAQQAQIGAITARVQFETAKLQYLAQKMETQNAMATYARTKLGLATEDVQFATAKYNLENILPAQKTLIQEQTEAQRGQTLDTRSDGSPVAGSVGAQKDLYIQQIDSYKRDAEVKAAKIFADSWTVQRTTQEDHVPPPSFSNDSIDSVLEVIKQNNGL